MDKSALAAKIDEAEALDEDDYTADSWANLQEALVAAREVYNDEEATQDEVDAALAALVAAINALELVEEPVEPEEPEIYVTIKVELQIGDIVPFVSVNSMTVTNLPGADKYELDYLLAGGVQQTTPRTEIDYAGQHPMFRYTEYVTIRIYDANDNLLHTFENVHLVLPQ